MIVTNHHFQFSDNLRNCEKSNKSIVASSCVSKNGIYVISKLISSAAPFRRQLSFPASSN